MSEHSQSSVIAALLSELPSISERWNEHRADWGDEDAGAFNDVAVLAQHLKSLYPARQTRNDSGTTAEFSSFFDRVEDFFTLEQQEVTELLTIGLFESLQNITASEYGQWTRFEPWLGTRSRTVWDQLIRCWNGNAEQGAALDG